MKKKFPINPKHPERNCWGCDQYCSVSSMRCGNGSERTQHPVELWGEDWLQPEELEQLNIAGIKATSREK